MNKTEEFIALFDEASVAADLWMMSGDTDLRARMKDDLINKLQAIIDFLNAPPKE